MPGTTMPEIPNPFSGKPKREKKENEGEFQVPQKSIGYMEKEPRFKEKRKLNVKKTVEHAAVSLGLLAGIETAAVLGGGPVEAVAVGAFAGPLLRPHAVYEENKKKLREVV
jgi:hypothetical protein